MAGKVPKLASSTIENTKSTPLFAWIRDRLLIVRRDPKTPPPGPQLPGGKNEYMPHNRYPNTQASRSVEPALSQGGVFHKIADNYYYDRDGRRMVQPPTPVYKVGLEGQTELKMATGEQIPAEQLQQVVGVNAGPEQNYGFPSKVPTPGTGYEWTRSIGNEEFTQAKDPELARAQKYDKYYKAGP